MQVVHKFDNTESLETLPHICFLENHPNFTPLVKEMILVCTKLGASTRAGNGGKSPSNEMSKGGFLL